MMEKLEQTLSSQEVAEINEVKINAVGMVDFC